MPHRKPMISHQDHAKLVHLIEDESVSCIADARNVEALSERLASALKMTESRTPPTVVRMNCHVTLSDLTTGDVDVFTLVDPSQADIACGKLSVLSPLGTAILGRHVRQRVRVVIPSGTRTVSIETISNHCQSQATATSVNTVAGN